ncbi:Uma2 family endonuclease [Argonema antarcticum]|uniref:Uma2 family endonuclease n=1 Tax=Argonema antarcticum TaxID=2942763 RepID=UPI00201187FD|nr:Uma2 family endonuclease [Argonema antarcticum]MCL1472129.1 Uma2 family endonuclease [Argonema antarcticum A004/B2]
MATSTQRLTLQDFLKLPNIEESPAWEFVDGQANQKHIPTIHHSILQKRLTAAIDRANSPYEAFPELRCTLSSNSVVPDITVIHKNRVPTGNTPVEGPPDWMIEILSPDQSTTKLIAKIQTCLQEGTKLGWLIDPTEEVIVVLWPDARIGLHKNSHRLPVLPDMTLDLTVVQVFGWVRDR